MVIAGFALCLAVPISSVTTVADYPSLRRALAVVRPGDTILLAPGDYAGGLEIQGVSGAPAQTITIGAADLKRRPRIVRGGIHLAGVSNFELGDLDVIGAPGNGVNADDGGIRQSPARNVKYTRIRATGFSSPGACALKMAGVDGFTIKDCEVSEYSTCGIDFVGCHDGVVDGCHLRNGTGVGVQAKGASENIMVFNTRFEHYGARGVNLGGSTGIPYFRPPIETLPSGSRYESKNVIVEKCVFVGGDAPIAFINCDGAIVRYNTIYMPNRWALRILQETPSQDFMPARNGEFANNVVAFHSSKWFEGGVNIGPNTAPKSFKFENNLWYCVDQPSRSKPTLPTVERGGIVGRDPLFANAQVGDFTLLQGSPATGRGAKNPRNRLAKSD